VPGYFSRGCGINGVLGGTQRCPLLSTGLLDGLNWLHDRFKGESNFYMNDYNFTVEKSAGIRIEASRMVRLLWGLGYFRVAHRRRLSSVRLAP
jgi:hypothetical protein